MMTEKIIINARMEQVSGYPYKVKRKAGVLKISRKELKDLGLEELREQAKKNYHILMFRHHPDRNHRFRKTKHLFIFLTRWSNAYAFFMDLDEMKLERLKQREAINKKYPERHYPLPWHYYRLPKIGYDHRFRWRA